MDREPLGAGSTEDRDRSGDAGEVPGLGGRAVAELGAEAAAPEPGATAGEEAEDRERPPPDAGDPQRQLDRGGFATRPSGCSAAIASAARAISPQAESGEGS